MGQASTIEEEVERVVLSWRAGRDPQNELLQLTLYERPPETPDWYVLRAWFVGPVLRAAEHSLAFLTAEQAVQWVSQRFPDLVPMEDEAGSGIILVWV